MPTEIGKLTALTELYLHNNRWNGTIPLQFGALVGLKELDLHSANLTGSIPVSFSQLIRLSSLYVEENIDVVGNNILWFQVVV